MADGYELSGRHQVMDECVAADAGTVNDHISRQELASRQFDPPMLIVGSGEVLEATPPDDSQLAALTHLPGCGYGLGTGAKTGQGP